MVGARCTVPLRKSQILLVTGQSLLQLDYAALHGGRLGVDRATLDHRERIALVRNLFYSMVGARSTVPLRKSQILLVTGRSLLRLDNAANVRRWPENLCSTMGARSTVPLLDLIMDAGN
jgi:hypothetical protein